VIHWTCCLPRKGKYTAVSFGTVANTWMEIAFQRIVSRQIIGWNPSCVKRGVRPDNPALHFDDVTCAKEYLKNSKDRAQIDRDYIFDTSMISIRHSHNTYLFQTFAVQSIVIHFTITQSFPPSQQL